MTRRCDLIDAGPGATGSTATGDDMVNLGAGDDIANGGQGADIIVGGKAST